MSSHKDAIAVNQEHFNALSNSYDKLSVNSGMSELLPKILLTNKSNFQGRLLDFACGTGIITEKFTSYFDEIVGIDINDNFLKLFNDRIKSNDGTNSSSFNCDILDESSTELLDKLGKFDSIFCTIAYHHLHNYEDVTKKLSTMLTPGGKLYILDFYNSDVENQEVSKSKGSVMHMGGLKKKSLINTLNYANLKPEIVFFKDNQIWQLGRFIENHATTEQLKKYENGELEKKIIDGQETFHVTIDFVLAIGTKV